MQSCSSTLLQADGSYLFQNRIVIKTSGQWTAPPDVDKLRIILVGKGNNGANGTDGTWDEAGVAGADGIGAKVWAGTININPQQQFVVIIGNDTVFDQYSSANGQIFANGYTDIASGESFARTGVENPIPGSGDGGAGGAGGKKGYRHEESWKTECGGGTYWVVDNEPEPGEQGVIGAFGCAIVYWDKEAS